MIEKDLKILAELVQEKGSWKQKQSFNKVVNHCDFLDNNFKDNTKYLEKLVAWYIGFRLEMNDEKWETVGDFHVRHLLLQPLAILLSQPLETYLTRIENNIQLIRLDNNQPFLKQGSVIDDFRDIIKDFIALETKDMYARTENRLRKQV